MRVEAVSLRTFEVAMLPAVAWRNGLGTTRELAVGPPGTALALFDWRVAVADIAPGATSFSRYPGVDRVLVTTGPGLRLGPPGCGGAAMRPIEPWVPMQLDGAEPVDARLVGAPVRVFNVMARRGAARGTAAVHRSATALAADATHVLWCVQGRAQLESGDGHDAVLDAGHATVFAGAAARLAVDDCTIVLAATLHG